jgi:hypothetical protein
MTAYLSNKRKLEKEKVSIEYSLKMSQVANGDISNKISDLERQKHKSQVEINMLEDEIQAYQR